MIGGYATAGATATTSTPVCPTSSLRVREVDGGAGAGTRLLNLSYEGRSRQACRTAGFPGVTVSATGGRRFGVAVRASSRRPQQLLIRPGKQVFGVVAYGETPVPVHEKCLVPTKLRIYPPDNRTPIWLSLHQAGHYCSRAEVYPLAISAQKSYDG